MRTGEVVSVDGTVLSAVEGSGSGEAQIVVAVDGHVAGVIVIADALRPDAPSIVERPRAEGVRHVAMLSGDRRSVAERVGRELGVDRVYSEQSPEDKLEVVPNVRAEPELRSVIMVGEDVNDARALAIAYVRIAMGVAGAIAPPERPRRRGTEPRRDGGRRLRLPPTTRQRAVPRSDDLAVILNALRALRG